MATKKTTPADAPAEQPAQQEPAHGGCWTRNADGSLSRDTTEHPAEPADLQTGNQEPTA